MQHALHSNGQDENESEVNYADAGNKTEEGRLWWTEPTCLYVKAQEKWAER